MDTIEIVLLCLFAVAVTAVITYLIMHSKLVRAWEALKSEKALREMQQESFNQHLEVIKGQLSAETEQLLKQREEALQMP